MSKFKPVLFTLIGLGLSCFLTFALLETGLRLLPVNTGFYMQAVTQDDPIAKLEPNQDFTWSDEWNFTIINHGRTNNDGFVNDQDYDPNDLRPLAAVIGDSFIQAAMTPYKDTVHGRMAADAAPDHRVYSFSGAGAPASQYLIWARYAQDTYQPDMMVFNMMGNDFDQSLPKYKWLQIFQQFVEDENGELTPRLVNEFRPSWKGKLVSQSALAQYLLLNLEVSQVMHKVKEYFARKKNSATANNGQEEQKTEYMNNVPVNVGAEVVADSKVVIDAFLRLLPEYSGLQPSQILFLTDAPRPGIYKSDFDPAAEKSYYEQMKPYFIDQARARGYEVIDLTQPFYAHFSNTGEKLEYETDGHWNEAGHGIAFEKVRGSQTYQRFLQSNSAPGAL